ncbi:RNA polymerase sigma factor SigF [Anabaena cylindrica FACHB-243]|uniref:RNA polymerase, sigma 28 subunit, FliA/WhiG subfamily n=1 Tax=Anabaena cylindrica (strain ATCC 27899 / PCC 7122) TaxID=272123 RepID=K9ZMJ4_ANACC|nr:MULTISPECIES: RNA polymerase sigma factor SigF [Anabaena]AFZ60014.1 RNA polymerase, sigma 28 subunit, FliA/WhiG subfamily [Anabaena cylindrica PCC 7122]MBD2417928.1 RNA polymerase sigma factor SigF [Anabaena cylindrica FACHB-243]MBY5282491.1 RNA polymerase sigma factor SigF [Anabaena sp. CCAP 1446/1C]MBY5309918.1 RNA polymerase sigma factor SigF [Anabaena sp. CCAP 1446/1C]MCM2404844.1 RNA polymerase sigma factor SigF [Anabaena sp. CCAP 1446/1C]
MAASESSVQSDGIELLHLYHRAPSIKLRNQLVQLHTGLVRKMAYKFSHQCNEPYEDLEQIGYFGLIRAIERFNPTQGYAFSSFAIPYIRGEMLHFLRDRSTLVRIPRRWQELYNEGQKIRKELTLSLSRPPKDIEIANKLHISLQEWQECKLAAQNRMPLSLDATPANYVDYQITLGDILPCPRTTLLQQQEEERLQLQGAMNMLDDKPRMAVELVFVKELTRKDAAKRIGASPMTVTRYLHKGIQELICYLQPQAESGVISA